MRAIVGSRTLAYSKVQRAQIVLGCAEGESHGMIAKRRRSAQYGIAEVLEVSQPV